MLRIEDLAELAQRYGEELRASVREFTIGGRLFSFNHHSALMGVINLSPDSWYRESICLSVEQAVQRGRILRDQGADLIDIGAESTLVYAAHVEPRDQSQVLLPVIRDLKAENILVSVEVYDPSVAKQCLMAGAQVLNLTGTEHAEAMFRLAAEFEATIILCYLQGLNAREVGDFEMPADPVALLRAYFSRYLDLADRCGLNRILIDPGMGFYYRNMQDGPRRVQYQMKTLLNSFRLRSLGVPICQALPHAFEFFGEEVRSAESLFAVLASLGKTSLFRTHEVPKVRAVLRSLEAF